MNLRASGNSSEGRLAGRLKAGTGMTLLSTLAAHPLLSLLAIAAAAVGLLNLSPVRGSCLLIPLKLFGPAGRWPP